MKLNDIKKNNGQVMLLAVLIIGASVLTMTSISGYLMLQRIRASSNIVDSTKAIFASDTGIEWETFRYLANKCDYLKPAMSNSADFQTFTLLTTTTTQLENACPMPPDITSSTLNIKSIGKSSNSNRAFSVTIDNPQSLAAPSP